VSPKISDFVGIARGDIQRLSVDCPRYPGLRIALELSEYCSGHTRPEISVVGAVKMSRDCHGH